MCENKDQRHVLGLSGGKDSSALAIYIKDKYPDVHEKIEYFFCDTDAELPEVYRYLDKLEVYLDKEIIRLKGNIPNNTSVFEYHLDRFGGMLPDARMRWCTREMKLKPFEKFIGNKQAISYVGIRADEPHREGYRITSKSTVTPVYPFKDDGLVRADIFRILEKSVGIPEYYEWRSRSGCYFCFFQRKDEWIGLSEHHPDLFKKATDFEKYDKESGRRFTWTEGESLPELLIRAEEIKKRSERESQKKKGLTWQEILAEEEDDDPEDQACLICSL